MPGRYLIPVDEDHDMGSGQAQPAAVPSGAKTTGSTSRTGTHGETQITPIPRSRLKPFNETEQVIMTYSTIGTLSAAASTGATGVDSISFRLNSIYDVSTPYVYAAVDPTAAISADAADGTIQKPSYREYWSNIYNYWSVVKTRYRLSFRTAENISTSAEVSGILYRYEHGLQGPPTVDTAGTPQVVEHRYRLRHPNLKSYHWILANEVDANVIQNYGNLWDGVEGYYQPGSVRHEVVEDELAQTWHRFNEVPPTPEKLTLIWQKSPRSDTVQMGMKYELIIEYTVQLKDLKAIHEYATATSSTVAVSGYTTQKAS